MARISLGLGTLPCPCWRSSFCTSSARMSLQSEMHSSQMYTDGPAMSFLTSFCDLPQKEQLRFPWLLSRFEELMLPLNLCRCPRHRDGAEGPRPPNRNVWQCP